MSTASEPRRAPDLSDAGPPIDHALDFLRDVPEKRHITAIRHYLAAEGYTEVAITEIVAHVRAFGSVWCDSHFDGEELDRREVERLLPGHPNDFPSYTDAFVWNLGPEPADAPPDAAGTRAALDAFHDAVAKAGTEGGGR